MKLKNHYGLIYLITIKSTGMIYVGQTVDLARRKREYKKAINYQNKHNNYKCIAELREVGFDDLEFSVLDYADSREELNQKEIEWIDKLDSLNPKIGLNVKTGGKGGEMKSDYYEKYGEDLKYRTLDIHTPNVKRKKSRRIIAFKDDKAIICDGGILFGNKFGFSRTNVTAVIKGKGVQLGGFYLFYLDDINEIEDVYDKRKNLISSLKNKRVIKYKEYVKLFELVKEGVETIENKGYKIEYINYE